MPLIEPRAGRVILTLLLIAAGLAFVWAAWHVLVAFLFAIFFAYLVDPVVQFVMHRAHISRGKAIAAVYLVIFVGLAVLFISIGPRIVHEGEKLSKTFPELYEKIASGQIAWQIGAQHGWSHETQARLQQFLAGHRETIVRIARDFGMRLARLGSNAWWLVLVPILAVFFLKDGDKFTQSIVEEFQRRRQQQFVEDFLTDLHFMLAHYIRAQLTLAAIAMGVYVAGLTILRVPYAFILGIIGGFLEFIPIVGPLITFVLMMAVSLGAGYNHLIILVAFLAVWRGVQDYVNSPRIMGKTLELHPLAVLFGVLAGGEVAGIIGVYLSVPIMAAFRIFWRRWRAYSRIASPTLTPVSEFASLPEPVDKQRSA